MSAPLHNQQKQQLAMLFRDAFEGQRREAREAGAVMEGGIYISAILNDFDEWRHEQVARACNRAGLTCCSQDDFAALMAHVMALLGRAGDAHYWQERAAGNPVRVALYKLHAALREGGLDTSYAAAICQRQYHCTLDQANAKQLWSLVYTVRNRSRKKAAQP